MSQAPHQVLELLASSAPFERIDTDQLVGIARKCTVMYLTQENRQCILSNKVDALYLIQNGSYSIKDSDDPVKHLSDGEFFGYTGLLKQVPFSLEVTVENPGLIIRMPQAQFDFCVTTYPDFANFFQHLLEKKLQNQAIQESNSIWLHKQLGDVVKNRVVQTSGDTNIQEAAKIMAAQRVSSLLVTEQHRLIGILTDRDIRTRIVAEGHDIQAPVSQVMTSDPASIYSQATLFDALFMMTEKNIHHLPVVDRESKSPIGMVTASDMVRYQRGNVLFLINELSKAPNLYELSRLSWQLPHYFSQYAKRMGDFDLAGKVLAQATDVMTRKLIDFFQLQHGEPPIDYCWLVYGSQAREDQTLGSDQDNALLLAQTPDAEQAEYFRCMADYVCGGLGKCGIKLCDGNIMASNPELRLSIQQALEEAQKWVNQPTPKSIMYFNIFLDVRAAAGNSELLSTMQQARAKLFKQNIFLAALARHNNDINVPLSMFNRFVFAKDAAKDDSIDLKKNAVAIINNLIRIYALSAEVAVPSTVNRIAALTPACGLSDKDAKNLKDIWLFLNRLRWRHQVEQKVTDNLVSISELSSIEKHQLKAAFQAIDRAQQAAVVKFAGGMA